VTTRGSGYRPELDGVRAFAILAVMAYHVSYIRPGGKFTGGFLGVDVFFVLSGYLITTLLVQEIAATTKVRLNYFYARRALRLLPALLLLIVFAGIVQSTLKQPINSRPYWQSALYALLYVGNWANAHLRLGLIGHTWSLAIEEQYYLVWPFVLVLGLRLLKSKRAVAGIAAFGAVCVAIVRYYLFAHGHVNQAALWTISRADGVLIGSGLALLLVEPPSWLRRVLSARVTPWLAGGAIAVCAFETKWNSPNLYRGGLFVLNLCAAALIANLVLRPASVVKRVLAFEPLPAIGRISYELYLFHVPMIYLVVGRPSRWSGWTPLALVVALSFVAATASYLLVDRPLMRVRKRFTPRREPPAGDTTTDTVGLTVDEAT
jgi:peptidoglycan/LPS O-acetylase OafA/YrhL